jgi:hypothetical protein
VLVLFDNSFSIVRAKEVAYLCCVSNRKENNAKLKTETEPLVKGSSDDNDREKPPSMRWQADYRREWHDLHNRPDQLAPSSSAAAAAASSSSSS